MENVRNFLSHENSVVLKLTLRSLIKLGYQCTFGVLQCGNYGIPQSRHRAFVIGAAAGQTLAKFPEPTHCFASRLSVTVDNKKYVTNAVHKNAPYRSLTVRDAIGDLPSLANNRNRHGNIKDHVCRRPSAIDYERILRIPHEPGADWRDLPNTIVPLPNGRHAAKL
ncbi:Hypothetical predicted protein [Paramuricea clavata]|uniref:DNA (cytosine-5-)-methyltransferase n=1 Tax=Paramuricea clavata TaxID=317549 RepID=A0A7D9LDK8_PARCT|nr:Hypothetical predicted protein [Paramuricea clavata]